LASRSSARRRKRRRRTPTDRFCPLPEPDRTPRGPFGGMISGGIAATDSATVAAKSADARAICLLTCAGLATSRPPGQTVAGLWPPTPRRPPPPARPSRFFFDRHFLPNELSIQGLRITQGGRRGGTLKKKQRLLEWTV